MLGIRESHDFVSCDLDTCSSFNRHYMDAFIGFLTGNMRLGQQPGAYGE